jgi:hypothetical protein
MAPKEITFSKLFSQTWSEYKSNFKTMFKFLFLFFAIPLIIVTLVDLLWIFQNNAIYELATNPDAIKEGVTIPIGYIITAIFIALISMFIYFFTMSGITAMSVKKKGYKVPEITKVAKASWLKYAGFVIVTFFFVLLLLLLFIIPGIIFAIYWIFAAYIFFYEKEGILVSLQKSKQLVKGHWWQVFGYVFLICLILVIIQIILYLPITIIESQIKSGSITFSGTYLVFTYLYEQILRFVSILISPFMILFFKNYYFALKSKNQTIPQPTSQKRK